MGRKIKVSTTVTMEVDQDDWELTFGTDGFAATRADMKAYLDVELGALPIVAELDGKVTVR